MPFWKRTLGSLVSAGAVWLTPAAADRRTQPGAQVTIDTLAGFPSRFLQRPRMIRVFLPPGYADSQGRYPVLYANDGQDAEAVGLRATLEQLAESGAMEPVIVVVVHATEARRQEYGVAGFPNAQGQGSEAAAYSRFLLEELMPLVEARYRVERGPARTAVLGWSLGGLAAFDLAWRHPDRFGTVGALSASFWWRTSDQSVEAKQATRIMHRVVRETPGRPALRMWFEAGREDEAADRDGDGVIDAIQDTRELMEELAAKGYREGRDMVYLEVDGGHNPETWKRVLPDFLRWAFGR